jgi:hypothetical protein
MCGDTIVAKELAQGGKWLSKEAFDDKFFGIWLHLELVHGLHVDVYNFNTNHQFTVLVI